MRFLRVPLVAAFLAIACSRPVDLTRTLRVTDVVTGFMRAQTAGDNNKVVPAISFRVRNVGDAALHPIELNAVFRLVDSPRDEHGSSFIGKVSDDGLSPGEASQSFTLRSGLGFTSQGTPAEMFQHRGFRDMKVDIFAKYRAQTWQKIGDFTIQRQLLAPTATTATASGR
jgi:hypothetical protein